MTSHASRDDRAALNPWNQPATLDYVRTLLANGDTICQCAGTITVTTSTESVLRCAACGSIEIGQADAAQDHQEAA